MRQSARFTLLARDRIFKIARQKFLTHRHVCARGEAGLFFLPSSVRSGKNERKWDRRLYRSRLIIHLVRFNCTTLAFFAKALFLPAASFLQFPSYAYDPSPFSFSKNLENISDFIFSFWKYRTLLHACSLKELEKSKYLIREKNPIAVFCFCSIYDLEQ